MFVNPPSVFSSFQQTIEFIKQDRLKTIVSCLALGILLISTAYWVYSYFWSNRQVKPQSPVSQKKDLSPIFDKVHSKNPSKSTESPKNSAKKADNVADKGKDLNHSPEDANSAKPPKPEQKAEVKKEIKRPVVESILKRKNDALKQLIKNTHPHPLDPIHKLIALQTHVHNIFENVYLGNLRAYYSIDSKFVKIHSMVDREVDMMDSFKLYNRLYHQNLSSEQMKELYQDYKTASKDGCSTLNIKHVISVTQFKPKDNVPADDWSRFQPDLSGPGISRIQISVDNDEFAWDKITPHFDTIFNKIDEARLRNEPILIHCVEGKSRSVSVLIAYLINRCGVTFDEALTFIQNIRPQAEPKPSVANALKAYQPT